MIEQSSDKEEILKALSKKILNVNEIGNILSNSDSLPTNLVEELSLAAALSYWNGQISYREGDCIMNNLFIYWSTNDSFSEQFEFPAAAWECYEAFDSGEFYRDKNEDSSDPSVKYTKPLVESMLKKRNLIR